MAQGIRTRSDRIVVVACAGVELEFTIVDAVRRFTQKDLAIDPVPAAKLLLGSVLKVESVAGTVEVRITEVEAYRGADDPASHSFRGRTPRNAVMFGPAGFLYVYFVYGMHYCVNVVCLTDGVPGAVLLRAGEVLSGLDLARQRRSSARNDTELAKGPARLASALGLGREHNGVNLLDSDSLAQLSPREEPLDSEICSGPRVGVATAADTPWRFWLSDSPTVSTYRRGGKRTLRTVPGLVIEKD